MAIIILTSTNDTYIFDGDQQAPVGAMGKVYKGLRVSDVRFTYERGAITGQPPEIIKLPKAEKNALFFLNNLKNSKLKIEKFKYEFDRLMEHTLADKIAIKPVAIKVLFSDLAQNPMYVQRFQRESQIKIKHPNVVEILDYVVVQSPVKAGKQESAKHHIVMEFLKGESLEDSLQKRATPFDERTSLNYIRQVLEGLNALHKQNKITHRDIKPNNLMVSKDETIKILDFGVAKLDEELDKNDLTTISTFIGTIAYASPEQINNIDVGPQSDIWACGIILFEMLTKRRPFEGDTADDTKRNLLNMQLTTPKIPGISPKLNEIIRKATHKDLQHRYKGAEEFLADVEKLLYPDKINVEERLNTQRVGKPKSNQTKKDDNVLDAPFLWELDTNKSLIWGSVLVTILIIVLFIFFSK